MIELLYQIVKYTAIQEVYQLASYISLLLFYQFSEPSLLASTIVDS